MVTLIVGVVCLFVGGFGGYKWGASVERRAAAVAASFANSAQQAAKKV